jgi:hypothetical protein
MSDYDDDFEQYDDDEFEVCCSINLDLGFFVSPCTLTQLSTSQAEDDTDAYDVLPKSMLPRQATPSPEPPKQAVRPPSASLYQQQNRPASGRTSSASKAVAKVHMSEDLLSPCWRQKHHSPQASPCLFPPESQLSVRLTFLLSLCCQMWRCGQDGRGLHWPGKR